VDQLQQCGLSLLNCHGCHIRGPIKPIQPSTLAEMNLPINVRLVPRLTDRIRLFTDHVSRLIPFANISNRAPPCPPTSPPGRSHWLRLLHVIEQLEEHILRANSLIRLLGSHGFLTDQYLLGPPIRFGEVNLSNTVFYRSAIHTRQGYWVLVINAHPPCLAISQRMARCFCL
jgi:hypothetical protein